VRLRRRIKAQGNCLVGHHEVGGRAARVTRGDRRKQPGSAGVVGKTHLKDGARLTERRGRGGRLGKA
jgi:hypothetical protein